MNFVERNANFWKWGLELALICFIALVGWSINHLSPSLFYIALAICTAELLATLVYTIFTTVPSDHIRITAWRCIGVIAISLAGNAIIHAALARKYDVAEQNEKKQQTRAEKKLKEDRERAEIKIKENESETQKMLAQNQQLGLIPRSRRQQITEHSDSPKSEIPIKSESESNIQKIVIPSPEQVQENAFTWILIGVIASVGAVIGTAIAFIRALIQKDGSTPSLSSQSTTARIRSNQASSRLVSPSPIDQNEFDPQNPNIQGSLSQKTQQVRARQKTPLNSIDSKDSPNGQSEAHRNSKVRLTSEAPEPHFDVSSEALRESLDLLHKNEPVWMAYDRVGDWEMPEIENCKWKWNSGQRSIELYSITTDPQKYLGRFGISAQEIWKSIGESERISLVLAQAQTWKDEKGVSQ